MRDFGQDPSPAATTSTNKGKLIISVIVLLAIAIAVVFYLAKQQEQAAKPEIKQPAPVVQESQQPEPETEPETSPEIDEPVPEISETVELEPEAEPEVPLPNMANSTTAVLDELKAAEQNVEPISGQQLIRDTVVFVDNLRQGLVIREKAVITGPTASFRVLEQNGKIYIDPRSYDRYNPMVDWFVSLDTAVLVSMFERYQPLVKQALGEIGYPADQDPNQMLLEAINVLLETPSVGTVIELNDDSVMYRYADPALEALPAAQKQMLRTGPDNIRRIKLKLEAIQDALMQ